MKMIKTVKWKILSLTSLVCLLPIVGGIALWNKLPDSIAIHFNINNVPDRFASKGFTVFGLPLLMVLLQFICCMINDVNAAKHGERKKLELATKWLIPAMTVLLQGITFAYALGMAVDIRKAVLLIVGCILLIVGNYLPKFDYIKNAEADTQKARKINRFLGFETVLMGILGIITIFLPPITSVVWLFLLILYAIVGIVYTVVQIRK